MTNNAMRVRDLVTHDEAPIAPILNRNIIPPGHETNPNPDNVENRRTRGLGWRTLCFGLRGIRG